MRDESRTEHTREKTAILLGISIRTLDRYRSEGRITPILRPKEGGGFVSFYAEEEIKRFQEELDAEAVVRVRRRQERQDEAKKCRSKRLQISLSEYHDEQLSEEANRLQVTKTQHARALIREGLESEMRRDFADALREIERFQKRLSEIERMIRRERERYAQAFAIVIELTGVTKTEAKDWAERNILAQE